jgi:gas vesicle protein
MDAHTQGQRNYGFVIGLVTGTVVGAGLAMWLAPHAASEIGERVKGSAETFGRQASDRLQRAGARVAEAVGEIKQAGQGVRDDVAEAVARGAREVERYATTSTAGVR